MGSVDPPRRLIAKLSAALCLRINHTNPLINPRSLLDNTNSPLQVIQAKTSREQGRGGAPRGSRAGGFHVHVRPRESTCALTACPPPRPDVCSQHHLWLLPESLQASGANWRMGELMVCVPSPPQPCHWPNSPQEDFFLFGPACL